MSVPLSPNLSKRSSSFPFRDVIMVLYLSINHSSNVHIYPVLWPFTSCCCRKHYRPVMILMNQWN